MGETRDPERGYAYEERALTLGAWLQVLMLAIGWGGNAPALRYSLQHLPPFSNAGLRFTIGLALILVFAISQRTPLWPNRDEWRPLAWMGALFTVQIALMNHGATLTEASRQALLINSYPLFVPLLAHFFLPGDRLTWRKSAGTFLAFIGILTIFGERFFRTGGSLTGDALVAASAVLLAGKAVYTRALMRVSHPYRQLVWQMVFAVPIFFAVSLATERQEYHWSPLVVTSILYQGVIVAGICFIGWTSLLQYYSPSRLSVGFFLTPVFGALLSWLLLKEPLTAGLLLGGAAILGGLVLVNSESQATHPANPPDTDPADTRSR